MIAVAGGRLLLRAAPESLAALLADGLDGIHAISDPFHRPRNCGLYLAGWAALPHLPRPNYTDKGFNCDDHNSQSAR